MRCTLLLAILYKSYEVYRFILITARIGDWASLYMSFTAGVGRWGDYSNGEVDTSGNFWLATQDIPNNGDQFGNWGNRVFEITG